MSLEVRTQAEQQIEVVIRLKPDNNEGRGPCVYLSNQEENSIVVEAEFKKEIFVFDHVAHQLTTQQDIYRMIGAQAVIRSLQGYNCCIFAYGQTGAGKTYSTIGDVAQLAHDHFAPSRGILPRLLEDLFASLQQEQSFKATCSYLEIYNEQIYDLLEREKKAHPIREDSRRGVFVEGATEVRLASYRQAVELLLQGDRSRRVSSTAMNEESSRSHVIFSVVLEVERKGEDSVQVSKAKLNIVDLAGSERVKHSNAEGERLRQASSINRSLMVLGNVINSLVENNKRKKHVPYRDSKLTHYLKDSLGGNSITKLLANVHCGREYYGDTLSTLMFAKRAKILKMRVEPNQNSSDNYEALRSEVRKLREELAQARYFKDNTRTEGLLSDRTSLSFQVEPVLEQDRVDCDVPAKLQAVEVLQQNELHYRALLQVYEEHMRECEGRNTLRRSSINKVNEWRQLQKKNKSLLTLVSCFPAFTKIYKENLLLKQERTHFQDNHNHNNGQEQTDKSLTTNRKASHDDKDHNVHQQTKILNQDVIKSIVNTYEGLLKDLEDKLGSQIEVLERCFSQLQQECQMKQKKIKELIRRQNLPPDLESLRNQNEYLQLNILNLENQVQQLNDSLTKTIREQQLKQQNQKRVSHRRSIHEQPQTDDEDFISLVLNQLAEVKAEAERQSTAADQEREQFETVIRQLQQRVNVLMNENNRLQLKYKRSSSQRRSVDRNPTISFFECGSSKKNERASAIPVESDYWLKTCVSSHPFKDEASITKELMTLRLEIKMKQKEIVDLKAQVEEFQAGDSRIEKEFGKNLDQVIRDYREMLNNKALQSFYAKNMRSIAKYKEPDMGSYVSSKVSSKRPSVEGKTSGSGWRKEEARQSNVYSSHYNSKKQQFFQPK